MTKRIFRSILSVSALVFAVTLALVLGVLYEYFGNQIRDELRMEAFYLAHAVDGNGVESLAELPQQQERITLVDGDGTVLFDNKTDPAKMENHAQREEIQEAMEQGEGEADRYSSTLSEKTIYYAVRLEDGRVLRLSSTQYTSMALLGGLLYPLLIITLGMLLLSAVFAGQASRKIVEPINHLDLDHPGEGEVYDELAPMLGKLNRQRRTIERQLKEAQKQQQEFALITDNMREGLLVIDHQTGILSFNASALSLLGTDRAPEAGDSVLTLNRGESFCRAVEAALAGQHQEELLQIEDRYCQLIANPVLREGQAAGAVLVLLDVTESRQRENLRREFTANVSHELKTPLTSISGYAEIIQNGLVKPEDVPQFAGKIFEESQRLITLVNDVIKISQLDEGSVPYERETIDLRQCAGEILARLQDAAERAKVACSVEGEPASIQGVRPILEEILYNLCDNAIKYNRPGGTVTVRTARTENGVRVTVRDTGIGIPAAHQSRVFERFYRVDKSHSREIGGTGLGLSIVKHGAAYLGATLELRSTLGAGTSISLTWNQDAQ